MGTVYSTSPEADLLQQLVDALPKSSLVDTVILLPTHRSVNRFKHLLAQRWPHHILPTILCLGMLDVPTLWKLALRHGHPPPDLPDMQSDASRALYLADALLDAPFRLVTDSTPFIERHGIARALIHALSECERYQVSAEQVENLKRSGSHHWQDRVQLFQFAYRWWQDQPAISLHQQRNWLLHWLRDYLEACPPESPWILAGSTGSQPATASLMGAIADLPQGQIWLPGYEAYTTPRPASHAFAGIEQLIAAQQWDIEITASTSPTTPPQRINAANPHEEATLIAALLREGIETPESKVACVSPDSELLRRVQAALHAHGVVADSAIGQPLAHHPQAALLLLTATFIANPTDVHALLACLKHPFVALDRAWLEHAERRVLCGQSDHRPPLELLLHAGRQPALELLGQAMPWPTQSLATHWQRHVTLLERLSEEPLDDVLENLGRRFEDAEQRVSFATYAHLLKQAMLEQKYFPPTPGHPRVALLSPVEARLMRYDRLVLAGLNEQTWPAKSRESWLHPMQAELLELPAPEAHISQQAHDFVTLRHAAKEVFITRSAQEGGSELLPARWLAETLTQPPQQPWVTWARQRPAVLPTPAPVAQPPASALPDTISATGLELLLRDAYGFYAKYILNLRVLDPLQPGPEASLRGSLLHRVLQRFSDAVNADNAALHRDSFLRIAKQVFATHAAPVVQLYWWPRLEALADDVVNFEHERRQHATQVEAELASETHIAGTRLTAQIDRLEQQAEGQVVIDYKSGSTPSPKEVTLGYAPQLLVAGLTQPAPTGLYYLTLQSPLTPTPAKADYPALLPEFAQGIAGLLTRYHQGEMPYYALPVPAMEPTYQDYAALERVWLWQ